MAVFGGFNDEDFGTLEGCSWRGRDALGGALKQALRPQLGPDCQSWGVPRQVELHVAKRSQYQYGYKEAVPVAKLFVYAYEELAFGLYVEAPGRPSRRSKFRHWRTFSKKLQANTPLRDALQCAAEKHALTFTDYYQRDKRDAPLGYYATSSTGITFATRGTRRMKKSSFEDFTKVVGEVDVDDWVNLHVYARLPKEKAIDLGRHVVDDILAVLYDLAPVYLETVS